MVKTSGIRSGQHLRLAATHLTKPVWAVVADGVLTTPHSLNNPLIVHP